MHTVDHIGPPQPRTLDAILPLSLSAEEVSSHASECSQLTMLTVGLGMLYDTVRRAETPPIQGIWQHTVLSVLGIPWLSAPEAAFVECCFHWYAVSVCNYCDLVYAIAEHVGRCGSVSKSQYRASVVGASRVYRDKVAAHYARTWPKKEDTTANQRLSVFQHLMFNDGRCRIAGGTISFAQDGTVHRSDQDYEWSLTELHEALIPRYNWQGVDKKTVPVQE